MKKIRIIILFIIAFTFLLWVIMNVSFNIDTKSTPMPNSSGMSEQKRRADPLEVTDDLVVADQAVNDQKHFDQYLNSLPTLDDLQNLNEEEVHHTPEVILHGGELIGRIQDEAENDPAKRVGAMNFFKKCSEDQLLATPIRAVCLSKIYRLIPEWKIPIILSDDKISAEVTDLALKLP